MFNNNFFEWSTGRQALNGPIASARWRRRRHCSLREASSRQKKKKIFLYKTKIDGKQQMMSEILSNL
jgi:hypothetical protein